MPTAREHQWKAEHNLQFLATVDPDEFCDWQAIVAFYVAVHLVERLRADVGQHSIDHQTRLVFVRENHVHIHASYRELYNISLVVRYGAGPHHWLNPDFVRGCLDVIQEYVQQNSPPIGP